MPRPGVSYLEIAKTATQLVEQNIRPSIEEVRKILKTGSNSTINRHLRDWREKQGNQLEAEQGLPETLLIAVKGLYDAIKENADRKINATQSAANQTISALQNELSNNTQRLNQLTQENHALNGNLDLSREEVLALQRHVEELNRQLEKKSDEFVLFQERLHDKKEEVTRLILQVKNAQDNLDHYRESLRKEREADMTRSEQTIKKLEHDALHAQTLSVQLKETTSELLEKVTWLERDKEASVKTLAQIQHKLNVCMTDLQSRDLALSDLSKNNEVLLNENKRLNHDAKVDKENLNTLNLKLEHIEGKLDVTTKALKKAEDIVATMSHQQLFLVQEKSELSIQLKQLQAVAA